MHGEVKLLAQLYEACTLLSTEIFPGMPIRSEGCRRSVPSGEGLHATQQRIGCSHELVRDGLVSTSGVARCQATIIAIQHSRRTTVTGSLPRLRGRSIIGCLQSLLVSMVGSGVS
jgi:hypothetical protein